MTTILGNTWPVKDRLKSLGGRWNSTARGWDVPDSKADEARALVAGSRVHPKEEIETTVALTPEPERNWSDEQKNIFEWFKSGGGSLLVRARAGTGKTTTIKHAFMFAPETEMLYAVFNKKNQIEAQEKITDQRVQVKTLHALGFGYIQRVWQNSKPDDQVEFDRVQSLCGQNLPDEVIGQIVKLVGFVKNLCIAPTIEEVMDIADEHDIEVENFEEWNIQRISEVALAVLELSKSRDPEHRISFNDMVWLPVAQGWVRPYFSLVCVDEAQDMNLPQLTMARLACRAGGRICVVGDDRQAIYGFRGAHHNGLDMMKAELNAAEMGLNITYRCPKKVVALANEFVLDYRAADAAQDGIVDHIGHDAFSSNVEIGNAVLSRLNAPLMPMCLQLLRRGVPARIEGRDIGRTLVNIVKKLKAKSVPDFLRRLETWANKQKARIGQRKNAESKIELVNDQVETLAAIAEGCASVAEVENRILSMFEDSNNSRRPAVVFSTVHKAKGLEWDRVFILRDTFLRKGRVNREEENIYYVAITRAKRHLVFVTQPKDE